MLATLENNSEVLLLAVWTLDRYFIARVLKMVLNFHSILYLFALRTWDTFFWALLFHMLFQLFLSKFFVPGALVRAELELCLASPLQVIVQIVVTDNFLTAKLDVWAAELEIMQFFTVQLVNFTWGSRVLIATILFNAY